VFAKATPASTERRLAVELRKDAKVVTRLRRMDVTVMQAAWVLTRGTAAAC